MKKLLIVYYSWSCGNTERTAKVLQSVVGGDLVRLDTAVPYSGSYNDVVDQGQHEVNAGFEPGAQAASRQRRRLRRHRRRHADVVVHDGPRR